MQSKTAARIERIEHRILIVRRQKVLLDADLAALYGVTTKRLNQQVSRNQERFPSDFVFRLNETERQEVVANCDHLRRLRFSATLPYAFTEHGALMAASVLNSPRAVEVSLYVVRAFVELRETLGAHKELAKRLDELEGRIERRLSSNDRAIAGILAAIREFDGPAPRREETIDRFHRHDGEGQELKRSRLSLRSQFATLKRGRR